jgi:hypothetical protein
VKKINLLLFGAAVLLFTVSCASTPKKDTGSAAVSNNQPQNEIPQAVPETQADSADTEPVAADDAAQSADDTDYSDLAEAVPSDDTKAAPAEEQPQTADMQIINTIAEPPVHDEPYTEKTTPSQPQAKETAPAAISGENNSEEQKKSAKNTETTPVQSLADKQVQQAPAAVPRKTTAEQSSSPVPAKNSSGAVHNTLEKKQDTAGQTENTADKKEKTEPSRSVTIDKNQYLDVTYPGTGWIYLGESAGTKNMIFFGRKLGETDTSFTLRSRDAGKSLLHFYKNDVLTGKYIDDYLEVNVTDTVSGSQEHVSAPSYADVVPPHPVSSVAQESGNTNMQQAGTDGKKDTATTEAAAQDMQQQTSTSVVPAAVQEQDTPIKTVIQTTESAPNASSPAAAAASSSISSAGNVSANQQTAPKTAVSADTATESADDLLREAQAAYDAKQYEKSQELLTFFFDKAVSRIDEGLYLQGEVLEAKSSIQNIKGAIDSYGILMKNWPESMLWKNAQQRSIYLKRMYIDIR